MSDHKLSEDKLKDRFNGSDRHLADCIGALLHFERDGCLVPHGIGGTGSHAYIMLEAAAVRLRKLAGRSALSSGESA